MKDIKIAAALCAMCIIGNVAVMDSDKLCLHAITTSAETGEFSDGFTWELIDDRTLKFSGEGELTYWPWVEFNQIRYSQISISEVIIDSGITKVGFIDYSNYGLEKITILNPECIICETPDNADPRESDVISNVRYGGVIYGYKDSTAQAYAEKHGFRFMEIEDTSVNIKGDVTGDGEFSVADIVLLQKWLLAVSDIKLADWKAADLCDDDIIDVFDLCLMRKALLERETFFTE